MKIIGIVSEYNPFHKGHEYQIAKSRELAGGDAAVVCVMSGDFVQRGEAALFSKYARAEAACMCGADLVVELPLPWALSSAEGFARGAVALIGGLGAEYISFGSENGSVAELEKIADCLTQPDMQRRITEQMRVDATLSYAAAREKALYKMVGSAAKLIEEPNNILAVEYIKAINELGLDIKALTVKREGAGHDSREKLKGYASASELRRMIEAGENAEDYIPAAAYAIFKREIEAGRIVDRDRMDTALISRLRMMSAEEIEALPDGENGVGRRVYKALADCDTLDTVAAQASAKRYAYSRIKRLCVRAALGIKKTDKKALPSYARVLAATDRGFEILRRCDGEKLAIITKPAKARTLGGEIAEVSVMGANAHDLYVLAYRAREQRKGGEDWKISPKIMHIC